MPVMGKQPVFPPHFTHKGVRIGKLHATLRSTANMGNNIFRFDLIGFYQICHRRMGTGLVIMKQAHPFLLKKTYAETICMLIG